MHTKRFNTCFKRWVQFRVGAIPRLPQKRYNVYDIFIQKYSGMKLGCCCNNIFCQNIASFIIFTV